MKNLNQYNEYSSKRQKELWDNLEKDEAKLIEKLTQFYKEESHKLGKEIAEYFARYGKDNVIEYRSLLARLSSVDRKLLYERFDDFIEKYPQYKHLTDVRKSIYKLTRLEGLNESIKLQQLEIGAKEVDRLHDYLVDLYGDTYYEMADSMGFGRTMLSFDKESAELLINKKWTQQKDYSDRIWENKSKLISYLTNDFKTSIIRGDSFNRVVKQMSERFVNRSRADIKRIVRTEGTRINNEAMMKTFDDSKLYDEYEYVAVIDRKTSDVCKDLDGEIFKLKDREVGINFPPMHVNCRSSFSVVIPDDYVDRYEKLYGDYFESTEIAENEINKLKPYEKNITSILKSIEHDNRSKLVGLDFRFKSIESLSRKIIADSKEKEISLEDAAKGINDKLRYTFVSKEKDFTNNYFKTVGTLRNKGYNIVRVKNTFEQNVVYKGVNTLVEDNNGVIFELQYHTDKSYYVKEHGLHEIYEKQRVLDKIKDKKEWDDLTEKMIKISNKIPIPKYVERIK